MSNAREILLKKFQKDPNVEVRIDSYYLPILEWSKKQITPSSTLLIGINGPQGCGKSTLCEALVEASFQEGLKAATLSVDDFYLTRKEQIFLAAEYKNNPFLQQRGYPGTHAVELGSKILSAIKNLKTQGSVLSPQYDKSAHHGKGDRFSEKSWKILRGPLDILFFEGWMLGFTPVSEDLLLDKNLKQINTFLESYRNWNALLDGFIELAPFQIDQVIDWRIEAEEKRIESGQVGMSKKQTKMYIKKFIPAYEIYLPQLKTTLSSFKNTLSFTLQKNRLPA